MNNWEVLGIEETNDKIKIKRAYSKKLKECHPEDNPKGFMKLRGAYEYALNWADINLKYSFNEVYVEQSFVKIVEDNNSSLNKDDSNKKVDQVTSESDFKRDVLSKNTIEQIKPITKDILMENFKKLYFDVYNKNSVSIWENFFLKLSLDEILKLKLKICIFLNLNYNLSQNVLKYLDKELGLCNNSNFNWSNMVKYDFGLDFEKYDENINIDFYKYDKYRFKAFKSLRNMNYKEAINNASYAETLFDMDETLQRIKGISFLKLRKYDNAINVFSSILPSVKDSIDILLYRGYSYLNNNEYNLAIKDFSRNIDRYEDHVEATKGLIKSLVAKKRYRKANKLRNILANNLVHDIELDMLLYGYEKTSHLKSTVTGGIIGSEKQKESWKKHYSKVVLYRISSIILICIVLGVIFSTHGVGLLVLIVFSYFKFYNKKR